MLICEWQVVCRLIFVLCFAVCDTSTCNSVRFLYKRLNESTCLARDVYAAKIIKSPQTLPQDYLGHGTQDASVVSWKCFIISIFCLAHPIQSRVQAHLIILLLIRPCFSGCMLDVHLLYHCPSWNSGFQPRFVVSLQALRTGLFSFKTRNPVVLAACRRTELRYVSQLLSRTQATSKMRIVTHVG